MTLSIFLAPNSSRDTYAVYISYGVNETAAETPTESKFDLLYVVPNRTALASASEMSAEDRKELTKTIFMPPDVHLGNGTYIIGVKLISKWCSRDKDAWTVSLLLDSTRRMNLTNYNSSYTITMYVSKCQYWDEKQFIWSSVGCQVGVVDLGGGRVPLLDLGRTVDNEQIHGMSLYAFDHLRQWFLCSTEYDRLQNGLQEIPETARERGGVQYGDHHSRSVHHRSNLGATPRQTRSRQSEFCSPFDLNQQQAGVTSLSSVGLLTSHSRMNKYQCCVINDCLLSVDSSTPDGQSADWYVPLSGHSAHRCGQRSWDNIQCQSSDVRRISRQWRTEAIGWEESSKFERS